MYNLDQIDNTNAILKSDNFLNVESDSEPLPNLKNKLIDNKKYKNSNCIGPCFPPNKYLYHPVTFDIYKSYEFPICPLNPEGITFCTLDNDDNDYVNYNPFIENIQIAATHESFLNQIYKLSNHNDIIIFLKNEISVLPLYSQQRLLNTIYIAYNDIATLDIFINNVVSVYNNINNSNISRNIINKLIIKSFKKNKKNNIFNYLEKNI